MKKWQWVITIFCIFIMFFNKFLPPIGGLTQLGMSTLCVFVGTMLLLQFVDLMWPVLLCIPAFPLSGIYTLSQTIQMSLGHPIFNFVVLCTMMLYVLKENGIMERIAIWMISRPFTKKNPWLFIGSLWWAELILGSIMDVTSIIILFTTIAAQIMDMLGIKKGDRLGTFIMLGLLVFAGLSYGITPISHSVPVLGISLFAELEVVSFLEYSFVGYVVAIIVFIIFMLLMKYVYKLELDRIKNFDPTSLSKYLNPMSSREKVSITIFIIVIILWLFPSIIENVLPNLSKIMNELGIIAPVLFGCLAMCLIRVNGKPLMDLEYCLRNGAAWGAAYPIAAAMLLGAAVTNSEAGLTDALINAIGPMFNTLPPIVFVVCICFTCVIVTTFASDTVALLLVSTITIAMIKSGLITGVNVGALTIAMGISACTSFTVPSGGTYPAVVAGQGWVNRKSMFFNGGLYAIIVGLVASTIGYYFGSLIL